jgi:hypothetical protein
MLQAGGSGQVEDKGQRQCNRIWQIIVSYFVLEDVIAFWKPGTGIP